MRDTDALISVTPTAITNDSTLSSQTPTRHSYYPLRYSTWLSRHPHRLRRRSAFHAPRTCSSCSASGARPSSRSLVLRTTLRSLRDSRTSASASLWNGSYSQTRSVKNGNARRRRRSASTRNCTRTTSTSRRTRNRKRRTGFWRRRRIRRSGRRLRRLKRARRGRGPRA